VTQNLTRLGGSALDARTTRHPGYRISQRIRKRIEEAFRDQDGWTSAPNSLPRPRRVQMHVYLVGAAYKLLRIGRLAPVST
jgi:hypothetical protein